MGKKRNNDGSEFVFRQGYENSFVSDVISAYNDITDSELETQKDAIKNIMEHIRRAYARGLTYEEIDDRVLYNMSNLFTLIKYPNLTNFYQLRTLEFMMDSDIEPYVEQLLKQGFDLHEYQTKLRNRYSANVEKNVILEIYGMISDFLESGRTTVNLEYHILAEKARNGKLTIEDKESLVQFLKAYLKELEIGKATYWEEQRRDLESCRKLLIKYRDQIFDVRTIDVAAQILENKRRALGEESEDASDVDLETRIKGIREKAKADQQQLVSDSVASMSRNSVSKPINQVTLKEFPKSPFISKDKEQNFLVVMSEALHKFSDVQISQIYEMLMASEYGKTEWAREAGKRSMYSFFSRINFQKNLLHAREHLMERLAALMTFYKSSGCLGQYCSKNNTSLRKNYLGDLQIDEDVLFAKFINNPENGNDYFVDDNMRYERIYRGTPLYETSDEAIIGMSAFYSNRMTKKAQTYAMLGFILDKLCIIERIGENPDLTYDDLECSDDDLRMYMSIYKCFQRLMVKNFFSTVSPTEPLIEEEVHKEISKALEKYKRVYEKFYSKYGLFFERDIDYVMMDAQLIEEMYALKSFSVKSLLYTAITDKKKNIINWGFVPENDNPDDKFVLLGFDIKTLNTPLFVHIKKADLIKFIKELTGDTRIRIYEGANDMYRHSASQGWQRITTQVLYPLSKDERRTLSKVSGTGALTDYYSHIRWLQQSNNPPFFSHKPGTREYDLETKEISIIKQVDEEAPGGKKGGSSDTGSKGSTSGSKKGAKKGGKKKSSDKTDR